MTIDEFGKLRHEEKWFPVENRYEVVEIPVAWGYAQKVSRLGDIVITYNETFRYDEYNKESFSSGTDGMDDVWSVQGVTVVDEDGEVMDAYDIADYLNDSFSSNI